MPAKQGIKSGRCKLSRLLSEKRSGKPAEHCEQRPRGGGAQGTSYINGPELFNPIKKSEQQHCTSVVGFDDGRVDSEHDPPASDRSNTAVSSSKRLGSRIEDVAEIRPQKILKKSCF